MLLSRIIRRIRLGWYALMRHRYREQLRKLFGPTTTIISNNCFGGRISQDLGYAYNSPTVGLFFSELIAYGSKSFASKIPMM